MHNKLKSIVGVRKASRDTSISYTNVSKNNNTSYYINDTSINT